VLRRPAGKLRICITGAGGFIASHLAKRLKSEGHYIIACDWKKQEYFKVRTCRGQGSRLPSRRAVLAWHGALGQVCPSPSEMQSWVPNPPSSSTRALQEESFCDEFHLVDLRVFENCKKVVAGCDHVFNLAADMGGMGFIQSNHAVIFYNNTMVSFNVLEAARQANCKRWGEG